MGNRTVTRRLFWQPRLATRTVRTVGDALPETRVGSRTRETTAHDTIRVPRGSIPPPRKASSAVSSTPPPAMHHSSDGSMGDGIAVGTAAASTDDARAVGGALTVCEVRVDGGDVEPKTAAQSPPRWRPSANEQCPGLFVSGGPGLRPRFAPTLPAPRADALIRAAAAADDAPIDALRRALTAELRDRKVRVDSLAAADAALGGGSASDVDATLRRDARFRRPGRDRPPAWVERLVAFVDDAPVFRTTAGVSDGDAGHPGAACTRETIGALERWVDASVRRVCRDGGGDASERANRAPAHPHNFITHGGGFARPSFDSFDAEAAAEGALWIYRVAFDELTEQVRRQCRDRGALLAKVWDHFFSVVEARAGLRYESLVADARVENIQTRAQLAKAKKEADALDAKRVELEEALAGERVALHRERTASSTAALAAKMRHRELRAEVDRLKTCDSEHRERLADSRVTERRLIADAEAARGRARDVAARLTREAEKVAVVEKRLAEETERAEGLKAELARVRAVVAERDRAVDALTTSLDDAARSLAREREGATALAGAFEECRAALEERTRVLDESNEANETLREKIERCRLDADDLRSALGDARAQRDALELDLHDARACIATGCTREASLRTTVGQLSEEMIETRRAAENECVRRERESARADGATADAEAATVKWRMEREALRSELVGVRGVMRDLAGGVRTLDDLAEGILAEDLEAKSRRNGSPSKDGVTDDDASVESVAADIVRGAALARRVVERLGAHRKELGDAVRARDVARSRLYDAHDDIANLEREVADAKLKTLRLEKDAKERDGVIASRDREIAKLRSACAERVEDAKATAARLLAEETRSAELRSERCALEREVKRRAKIAEDLDACRVELEASEESRVGLTSVVEGLKAEREALEAGTRAAEGRIARLASNVEALEGDRMRLEELVRSERSEHERAMRDERERLRASAKRGVDRATREWAKCETRLAESEERLRKTRARASVTSRLKVGLLTRRCETLAVKLAASNVAAIAQRESFVRDMLAKEKATTELVREVRRAQLEWAAETSEAIAEVSALRDDAAGCVAASCVMRRETDGELREYRRRFATARDASQQCDDACVAHLVERARRQPRLFDESADSKGTSKGTSSLLDARRVSRVIVETYLKRVQLAAGEAGRARDITHGACGLGALGNDTVHDALRRAFADAPRLFSHPSSAEMEPGDALKKTLGSSTTSDEDAEQAVDRVMASARHHARRGDAKCAAFCRFADCIDSDSRHADSDRRFASREAFHVFCSVLGCAMKAACFDDEFSVTLRDWRDGAATISTRVAMDVVANVYNTDAPRDVPVVRESLIRIRSEEFTTEGGREVGLDFDFFLSRIMEEYAAGRAPVNPMEAPRRVESAGL